MVGSDEYWRRRGGGGGGHVRTAVKDSWRWSRKEHMERSDINEMINLIVREVYINTQRERERQTKHA